MIYRKSLILADKSDLYNGKKNYQEKNLQAKKKQFFPF